MCLRRAAIIRACTDSAVPRSEADSARCRRAVPDRAERWVVPVAAVAAGVAVPAATAPESSAFAALAPGSSAGRQTAPLLAGAAHRPVPRRPGREAPVLARLPPAEVPA